MPALSHSDYEEILRIMKNMALVMERSPRAFADMEEEMLRWHFLVQLNGAYEGQATGETFNFKGKTDVLIRVDDRNVFIAECKFWKGEKAFLETIDQLVVSITVERRNTRQGHTLVGQHLQRYGRFAVV